jgi:hypothetical protein
MDMQFMDKIPKKELGCFVRLEMCFQDKELNFKSYEI